MSYDVCGAERPGRPPAMCFLPVGHDGWHDSGLGHRWWDAPSEREVAQVVQAAPKQFRVVVRDQLGEVLASELMDRGRMRRFLRQTAGETCVVQFRRFPSGPLRTVTAAEYEMVVDTEGEA